MPNIESNQEPGGNTDQASRDKQEFESLGLTLDRVRDMVLELELGVSFDELYQDYKEMTDASELTAEGFIIELLEAGGYQAEAGDDISVLIEIGILALCGGCL